MGQNRLHRSGQFIPTAVFFSLLLALPFLEPPAPDSPDETVSMTERVDKVSEDMVQMRRELSETQSALERVEAELETP
jgi:hypothetical protein